MKLIQAAPSLIPVSKIRVHDSRGNVWEVTPGDTVKRRIRYSDYRGQDTLEERLSVQTPDDAKETLEVPPLSEWEEGKTYEGVLCHSGGSIVWA